MHLWPRRCSIDALITIGPISAGSILKNLLLGTHRLAESEIPTNTEAWMVAEMCGKSLKLVIAASRHDV